MAPTLRPPLRSLWCTNLISRGAAGHVFHIGPDIVCKCATEFDDPFPRQAEEMVESAQKIEAEKAIYRVLMQNPHPNILQCLLILTSALAWLEHLGFVHGDLLPDNILLGANDNLHIADFDITVRPGEELKTAGEPFCKTLDNYTTPPAGPLTEQYALASCIYTIRFGREPWGELNPAERGKRMRRGERPSVVGDALFGEVIRRGWHGEYASVADVKKDVLCRLGITENGLGQKILEGEDAAENLRLKSECEEFVAKNRKHHS